MDELAELQALVDGLDEAEIEAAVEALPDHIAYAVMEELERQGQGVDIPDSPVEHAVKLIDDMRRRPHIDYISERVKAAVEKVEAGQNQRLILSLPPRSSKSTMAALVTPSWILTKHPDWKCALTSYDGRLASSWSKTIRRWVDDGRLPGVRIQQDTKGVREWDTVVGGGLLARSLREPFTGRGANVLVIDDPHKDFVDAHSATMRDQVWNWWLSVAQLRLEPPYLVIVVQTRWHEDDLVGRLLDPDREGDPEDWEVIRIPAIADHDPHLGQKDVLGREPGEPLISPLLEETADEAQERWQDTKRDVGQYVFSSMYQQSPAPATGAVFNVSWWKFWTTDPDKATEDGSVVYLDPHSLSGGQWLDSWDLTYDGGDSRGDFVVGQRWVRSKANRYLIAQQRGRWTFTETLAKMREWRGKTSSPASSPYGEYVHQTVIEKKANGAAMIDTLKDEISGLKPYNPKGSKEARARSITPEIESGNVYLPHPSDTGKSWVNDLISELRNFPHEAHDDQVDALSQALLQLRQAEGGTVTVPGRGRGPQGAQRVQRNARQITRNYGSGSRRVG